jgi:hypothetical protein
VEDAPPLLDDNALNDLSGGDEAETRAVLRDFLDATAQDLAQLAQARAAATSPRSPARRTRSKGPRAWSARSSWRTPPPNSKPPATPASGRASCRWLRTWTPPPSG